MAAHSNILAWEIPWTEEPGGLQSMGLQRVGYDSTHVYHYIYIIPVYTQIYNGIYNGNTYSYIYILNLFLIKLMGIYILIFIDQKFYVGSIKL